MWGSVKGFLSFRTIVFVLLVVVAPFALYVVEVWLGHSWLVIALLFVIVSILTAFLVEHRLVPPPYRKMRKLFAVAAKRASVHPMLLKYYEEGISRTTHELESIASGRFSFFVNEVPEMSVYAMSLVDKSCVLTFPIDQSERLLLPDSGPAYKYYRAMLAASGKMQENVGSRVVRIFILKKSEEISAKMLAFIKQNISDGIDVRLLYDDDVPPIQTEMESLDFGLYETKADVKWVMILRRVESANVIDYVVETNPARIEAYFQYSQELLRKSKTFDEFMQLVVKPVNGDLWPTYFAERRYEMAPPHGLSDEDADYVVNSALRRAKNPHDAAVLVLGFTPKLIKRLLAARVGNIVSYDQCESKPPEFYDKVRFETGNWLNVRLAQKFDAVIFDEAVNNLSRTQLSLFFPQMANLLQPRGALIGRVMGRFDSEQANKYLNMTSGQAVELLKKRNGNTHDDFAPLIICLLHSQAISYSPQSMTVDCEKWNRTLSQLRSDGHVLDKDYRKWRLQFDFKLLSPDQETLFKEARLAKFGLSETRSVEGSYVGKWSDTASFYKIYNFEYLA